MASSREPNTLPTALDGNDRFELIERLGEGGMGVVFRVYDHVRGEEVALKTLSELEPKALTFLKEEFRALCDVRHPNLAILHELSAHNGAAFFTMELVRGRDWLEYVLNRDRRGSSHRSTDDSSLPMADTVISGDDAPTAQLPNQRPITQGHFGRLRTGELEPTIDLSERPAWRVDSASNPAIGVWTERLERLEDTLVQLTDALDYLHGRGKLHCDIKPSNVLVTQDGRVVVLDFGLARNLRVDPMAGPQRTGVFGTIPYMAPEQAISSNLGPPADWYAVGCLIYQALTGKWPFTGDAIEILATKQSNWPEPVESIRPQTPQRLQTLCHGLLHPKARLRFGAADIRRLLGVTPASASSRSDSAEIPLFGRDTELDRLWKCTDSESRDRPPIALLRGASGIGKSRLLAAFTSEWLGQPNGLVLAGRCYERETLPYKAFDAWVDGLAHHLGQSGIQLELDSEERAALTQLFPAMRSALPDSEGDPPLDPFEARAVAIRGLRRVLHAVAREGRVLCAIDDIQWADRDSARLFAELVVGEPSPACAWVLSSRSPDDEGTPIYERLSDPDDPIRTAGDVAFIDVPPLDATAAAQLARHLGSAGDTDVIKAVVSSAQGNAFLLTELARLSVHAEHRTDDDVAGAIDDLLAARLEALSEDSREMLSVICLANGPVREQHVLAALDAHENGRERLSRLASESLIRVRASRAADRFEPAHDRIREFVSRAVEPEAQIRVHSSMREVLRQSDDINALAYHSARSDDPASAIPLLDELARRSERAFAYDQAADAYRDLLEISERTSASINEADVTERLGSALHLAGRPREAAAALERAAALAPAGARRALILRAGSQHLTGGYVEDGMKLLRGLLREAGLRMIRSRGGLIAALVLRRVQLAIRGLAFTQREESECDPELLHRVDVCLGVSRGLGMAAMGQGAYFQVRAALLALRAGELQRVLHAYVGEAAFSSAQGIVAERRTRKLLDRSRGLAERIGTPYAETFIDALEVIIAANESRWTDCYRMSSGLDRRMRTDAPDLVTELAVVRMFRMWSQFALGRYDEMARELDTRMADARARGDLQDEVITKAGPGHIAMLASDRPQIARRELHEVLSAWTVEGYHVHHVYAAQTGLNIALYERQPLRGWSTILKGYLQMRRSLFFGHRPSRVLMLEHVGRGAVGALGADPDPATKAAAGKYLRSAIRQLRRNKDTNAQAYAMMFETQRALLDGDSETARARAEQARRLFDADDFEMYRRLVIPVLRSLADPRSGNARAEAYAWGRARGVKRPERFVGVFLPGVPEERLAD